MKVTKDSDRDVFILRDRLKGYLIKKKIEYKCLNLIMKILLTILM